MLVSGLWSASSHTLHGLTEGMAHFSWFDVLASVQHTQNLEAEMSNQLVLSQCLLTKNNVLFTVLLEHVTMGNHASDAVYE